MPPSLPLLTDALMRTLGRHSNQDHLCQMLRESGMDASTLLRADGERPYLLAWPEHGLTVQMQTISATAPQPENPNASSADCSWGLHSVTFEAARWRGPWPGNLSPQSAAPNDWINALPGDEQTRTEILRTPEMACLSLPGADGQTWSAVLLFDSAAKLQSLTFARAGDWIAASTVPPSFQSDRPQPIR